MSILQILLLSDPVAVLEVIALIVTLFVLTKTLLDSNAISFNNKNDKADLFSGEKARISEFFVGGSISFLKDRR